MVEIVKSSRFEDVREGTKRLVAVRRALLLHSTSPGYLFGDMKQGRYYVSDYIRDFLGFDSNVIMHLPHVLAGRMFHPEDRKIHLDAIEYLRSDAPHEAQFSREWYFRVKNAQGHTVWLWAAVDIFRSSIHPVMVAGSIKVLDTMALVAEATKFFAYGVMLGDVIGLLNRFSGWHVGCFVLPKMTRNEGGNNSGQNFLRTTLTLALSGRKDRSLYFFRLKDNVGIVFADPQQYSMDEMEQGAEELLRSHSERLGIAFEHEAHVTPMCDSLGTGAAGVLRSIVQFLRDKVEFDDRGIMGPGGYESLTFKELYRLGDACVDDFGGFGIVMQPLIGKASRKIIGCEVLMRMTDEKNALCPDKFVPIFENSRLMVPLGRHLFDMALEQAKECIALDPDFIMSINVSGAQTSDPNLLAFVEAALQVNGLSGRNFMIEITESHSVESERVVIEFMKGCRRLGMLTAIDDFGEGFSSVRRLMSGQFDVVKLGADLTLSAVRCVSGRNFLENIIAACRHLEVQVCVEGIENAEVLDLIDQMDCNIYQGYHFGRPMSPGEFMKKLMQQREGS